MSAEFLASLPFAPDRFQVDAIAALEAGRSVVVTAPTGAGKTVVAEGAVHMATTAGLRAFYTTPLKALSNQKFADFREVYGEHGVGLLTGDNSINPGAPVVVMTTEVLRNMIYVDSAALAGLGVVVLDEVHYLQDPFRGMVWEEVIIHLPAGIPIVALSATVSNAGEFTEWLATRRGPTELIVESHRPVPLQSLYLVKDRHRRDPMVLMPVFQGKGRERRPNEQIARLLKGGAQGRGRLRVPRRFEVAEVLRERDLLPAIYFVFSRAGCDAAADQVLGAGLRFTDAAAAAEIADFAAARTAHLPAEDLAVLGYGRWLALLEAGIAAHHAGKIPAFKEAVEELFRRGLVKLVFATETLALGINMPARCVVLENLSKFTGETHEMLRPGDYTQLTGRAGRRGIDTRGTAIVLYSPYVPFDQVADIAAAGSHPLRSSFRPNYNMAANLVANYDRKRADELLAASFGHFHRTREREELRGRITRLQEELAGLRDAAECDRGDIWSYAAGAETGPRRSHGAVMRTFAAELTAGDVLEGAEPVAGDRQVLLARGFGSNPRLLVLSATGRVRRVRPEELAETTRRVGTLELPEPFRPRDEGYQQEVVALLRGWETRDDAVLVAYGAGEGGVPADPVTACPDLADHLQAVRRLRRAERDVVRLENRVHGLGNGLTAQFHRLLGLLEDWGYTRGWSLTTKGARLRRVHNELDLVVTEAGDAGWLAELTAEETAALVSVFVFDPRGAIVPGRWPSPRLAARWEELEALARRLARDEAAAALPETRPPEPGFAELAYYWASGADLEDLLDPDEMAAGDFVRTCRQLIDLLVQIRDAFPELARAGAALAAVGVTAELAAPTSGEDVARLVAEGAAAGHRRFIAVGGDGTVNLVVDALMRLGLDAIPTLGILPAGSGGDFIRTFAIPRDMEHAAAHLASPDLYRVDVGHLRAAWGDRYFLNAAGIGLGAEVVREAALLPARLGAFRYKLTIWPALARLRAADIELECGTRRYDGPAVMVVFANGQYFGGGMNVAPRASLGDGLLDTQVFVGPKRVALVLQPRVTRGTHLTHRSVRRMECASFVLRCSRPWPVEADGEHLGDTSELSGTVVPGAIDVSI